MNCLQPTRFVHLTAIAVGLLMLLTPEALAQRSTPVQVLQASGAANDNFGQSVAIDGDTMIVGVPRDLVGGNPAQGSVEIYRWTGSGWSVEATLIATGGAANDNFGVSVAIQGNTAIVGANLDDVSPNADQGSAYVFTRSGTTWTQQAQLTAAGGAAGDQFGIAVAIADDAVIVGASLDDVGGTNNQGSAYVFTRSGTTWTQQAQLTAAGGAASDQFGASVALSGDTAIIGARLDDVAGLVDQGSAYIFVRSGATWTQQAQLIATAGDIGDNFGASVAISGDTAIIGARADDVGANPDQGSASIFIRSGTTWTQQAQLSVAGGAASDQFGIAVAISGQTVIVGANRSDWGTSGNQGSVSVFTRSGTTWSLQAQLTASDGAANDDFGRSVGLSGDFAIIGAPTDDVGANGDQGTAWVFSRVGSFWIGPDLQLLASGGAANDNFGHSVALSGDTALVGAYQDDVGANSNQGLAYVFVRLGTTWTQQAHLTAMDGAAGDLFGGSVALSGDTALVGAYQDDVGANSNQGSAYVFTRSGSTWTQQAQLLATGGAANDSFGHSVALSGDTALVGAFGDDVGANSNQGSAFIFTRSGNTWTQQAQLAATGGAANDQFGGSVALSGDTALVGAFYDDVGANPDQGSAYVFTRSGSTWTQQARLTAFDGATSDQFGASVALSGDTALVGANGDGVGANIAQGSAYVFTRSGTTWTQQAQLTAADGAAIDQFGASVALSGDTALVGAYLHDVGGNTDQGSAYVFTRSGTMWTQQAQLTATGGAAFDLFGISVALSDDTALLGVLRDDVGASADQGSAWTFDVPAADFSLAQNDVTGVSYPTLSAALTAATNWQQITGTEAAWRTASSLDTAGRRLVLQSGGDIRTPSTTAVTLGGSSTLGTPAGNTIEIFGAMSVPANQFAVVASDWFRLGSSGSLRLFQNAALTFDTPMVRLEGTVQLDSRSSLDLRGKGDAFANLTAAAFADISATGTLTNHAAWSLTSASVGAPVFANSESLSSWGTSGIFGDFLNEAGATTTIVSGRLFVVGSLTNNGTIVGTLCSNCLSTPPNLDVGGDLTLGPSANLNMPFTDSLVYVAGDFNNAINANTRYDLSLATLQLEGTGTEQTLEVMSADIGASDSGLDRTIAGHYPIGTLRIGPSPSTARLVDAHDNDNLGQGSCEAIYVDTLRIEAGSRLINTSCKVYYRTLINNGVVDVPANLVLIVTEPVCDSIDFNNDTSFFDPTDIEAFLSVFSEGPCIPETATCNDIDFNNDGALFDPCDIDSFLLTFSEGPCTACGQ